MTRSLRSTLVAPFALALGQIVVSQAPAATPISPIGGALSQTSVTTFTWAYDASDFPQLGVALRVATSPTVDADGRLVSGNLVGCVAVGACGFSIDGAPTTASLALPQGDYWWQLSYDAAGKPIDQRTAPQAFSVPAAHAPSALEPADGATLSKTGAVTLAITTGDASVSGYAISSTPDGLGSSAAFVPLGEGGVNDVVSDNNGVLRVQLDGGLPNGGLAAGTYWWAYQYAPVASGTVGLTGSFAEPLLTQHAAPVHNPSICRPSNRSRDHADGPAVRCDAHHRVQHPRAACAGAGAHDPGDVRQQHARRRQGAGDAAESRPEPRVGFDAVYQRPTTTATRPRTTIQPVIHASRSASRTRPPQAPTRFSWASRRRA